MSELLLVFSLSLSLELAIELISTACDDPGAKPCHMARNSINVNGIEYSKDGRGFNIAVFYLGTGQVEKTENFDTFDKNKDDSTKMAQFLQNIPENRIVLGVVKVEATYNLKMNARRAIVSHRSRFVRNHCLRL